MADNEWHVDMQNGNDTTGTGTLGNPYKTIQKAEDQCTLADFDHVWIKATADYTEQVTLGSWGTTSPTEPNYTIYEGYTTTKGDGGIATIDGQSTRNYGIYDGNLSIRERIFRNIKVKNTNNWGWYLLKSDDFTLENCHADNCGDAFYTDNSVCMFRCSATSSGEIRGNDYPVFAGVYSENGGGTNDAFYVLTGGGTYFDCVVYNPGWSWDMRTSTVGCVVVLNCLNDDGTGLQPNATRGCIIVNSVLIDATLGIDPTSSEQLQFGSHNCVHGNITNYDANWNSIPKFATRVTDDDFNTDPSFEDEANQDYEPTRSSNLVAAGYDYSVRGGGSSSHTDVGPIRHSEDMPGGAGTLHPIEVGYI